MSPLLLYITIDITLCLVSSLLLYIAIYNSMSSELIATIYITIDITLCLVSLLLLYMAIYNSV